MNKSLISIRGIIFGFWVIVIGGFLFSPRIMERFLKESEELNLITFTGIVMPDVIKEFKEKTGIKIRVTYFESNEELFAKLKISGGNGYDLLVASDYAVELLIKNKLVAQLDAQKISNFKFLDQRILNLYFDPGNKYSLPITWAVYGIGYNKKIFGELKNASWDLIFKDPKLFGRDYKICMQDDPREAIHLAELYLFKKVGEITEEKLNKITELLLMQKKWVDVYSNLRQDYFLLSETVPLAVIPSEYMIRVLRESKDFGFFIPEEGSLMSIENITITASSKRVELAHKFIDYILDKDVVARNSNKYGPYPVNVEAIPLLDQEPFHAFLTLTDEKIKKLGTLKIRLPLRKIEDLWLAIKAS